MVASAAKKIDEALPVVSLNIHQRLHAVMKDVAYVQKETKMVNNQYTFVSHDAVTAKVRVALIEHGVLAISRVVNHVQSGNLTLADIEVDFINIDRPEDLITVPSFGYGIDGQDKGPGKAVTYAVKYAFLKSLCLETGDDPERSNIDRDGTGPIVDDLKPPPVVKMNAKQVAQFVEDALVCLSDGDKEGLEQLLAEWSNEEMIVLWGKFNSQQRAAIKELRK